ncbi:MAG TPA: hypothetical protein VGR18_14710 [Rubrobacter sp.]|nr:hypothetical protein [Rubrobacter sp.]
MARGGSNTFTSPGARIVRPVGLGRRGGLADLYAFDHAILKGHRP